MPLRVRVVMLLFFESLPEISVNTELSFSSAMVFVWFLRGLYLGYYFLRNVLLFGIL